MYCLDCDYCLIGLPGNACPECGLVFDRDDPETFQPEAEGGRIGGGPRVRRLAGVLTAALWCYPPVLVGVLYLTWFVAWAALGHRPRFSLDDPKSISAGVTACYNLTLVVMIAFPAAFLLGFFATSWSCVVYRKTLLATLVLFLAYLGLWVAMAGLVQWDPAGVVNWFMD